MGIQDEIKELQRKAGSYDLLKEEYDALKDAIDVAVEKLNALIGISSERKRQNTGHIVEKEYELLKIQDGYQLDTKVLRKKYPELKGYAYSNIITQLCTKQGIHSTKDGSIKRIFYHKKQEEPIKIEKTSIMG